MRETIIVGETRDSSGIVSSGVVITGPWYMIRSTRHYLSAPYAFALESCVTLGDWIVEWSKTKLSSRKVEGFRSSKINCTVYNII